MRELKRLGDPSCTLCPLHKKANRVCVMGDGLYRHKAFVVGEAPGRQEDARGKPFVGPAGKLLRSELLRAGLNPNRLYLTNVAKCWPQGTPTEEEATICADKYLKQEIMEAKPNWILAVGSTATRVLTGYERVSEVRGQVLDSCYGVTLVIPTWHPSYVLHRRQSAIYEFREDLAAFVCVVGYDL
jgi:uracil-DNA glycosylase family 4